MACLVRRRLHLQRSTLCYLHCLAEALPLDCSLRYLSRLRAELTTIRHFSPFSLHQLMCALLNFAAAVQGEERQQRLDCCLAGRGSCTPRA